MPAHHLVEYGPEIGGDRQVAAVVALLSRQPGPAAVDLATLDPGAEDHHRVAVAVIGAAIAVFGDRAPELGHRENDDVLHPVAEIAHQGGDAAAEVVQAIGELPGRGPLV